MPDQKKINVLVIPDLFPKFSGDLQGIFLLDYLKCTEPYCNNTVFSLKIRGTKQGMVIEQNGETKIYRYSVSENRVVAFLKPFYYLNLFLKGSKLGEQFTQTNIIHAHGTIVSGTIAYLLSKKLKVPFIITEHQGPFSVISDSFVRRNWSKYIMQKANKVLVVSEHLKNEIEAAGIRPKSVEVTYNPVDTELFKLKASDSKKIVFTGRLDNFKGALRCVTAFNSIHNEFPEWKFLIVGDGEDTYPIKKFISENEKLKPKIVLTGSLLKQEMVDIYNDASFFIFPSRHESFGLVVAEALSSGLPVITGNRTAPKEFINKQNGLLVSPDSIEEIAAAMREMILTHATYNSQFIREQVVQRFSFDSFGKRLNQIYRALLN